MKFGLLPYAKNIQTWEQNTNQNVLTEEKGCKRDTKENYSKELHNQGR
jgi:hypothetical protein